MHNAAGGDGRRAERRDGAQPAVRVAGAAARLPRRLDLPVQHSAGVQPIIPYSSLNSAIAVCCHHF